jgi:hypothetical protein
MNANPLGRDVRKRMVQRLDMRVGAFPERGKVEGGILNMTAHSQVGAIDLKVEAAGDDCLIFRPHRCGDSLKIGILRGIIIVAEEQRYHARRCGRDERVVGLFISHGRTKVFDIGADGAGIRDSNRSVACWGLAPRPAGIAEHALRQIGKVYQVLINEGVSGSSKTRKPILDVGRVTRLRHFAVTDYGNA